MAVRFPARRVLVRTGGRQSVSVVEASRPMLGNGSSFLLFSATVVWRMRSTRPTEVTTVAVLSRLLKPTATTAVGLGPPIGDMTWRDLCSAL